MSTSNENALWLLEREDRDLEGIFRELDLNRGGSVEQRAAYGDLAKKAIRHIATREAALVEVTRVIESRQPLKPVAERLQSHTEERRTLIDRVEKMSRGVQGINLNTGQEFDAELRSLARILHAEISWELTDGIPAIRRILELTDGGDEFRGARHVEQHAPMNLNPAGPRWYERAPLISRIITVYDHLRDFPRAAARSTRSR